MLMEYARLAWRRCLVDETGVKNIAFLKELDTLNKRASPTSSAAVASVVVPETSTPSRHAVPGDEKDWTVGDLVEIHEEERVEVKRRLCDLQDLCRAERRQVPEIVSVIVRLAVELMAGADVLLSSGEQSAPNLRAEELT